MHDANTARQCSGGKVVWCTGQFAEHSPRFSGDLGDRNPPSRLFLLYRQRHVLFLTGQKENVGLELWVLETVTLWLTEANTKPAARYFPPTESTQRSLGRCDAPQTPVASATQGVSTPWALSQTPGERHRSSHCPHILSHTLNILIFFRFFGKVFFRKY